MSAQHTHPRDWPTTPGRLEAIHGSTLVIEGTGERIGRCGDHGPHVANARRIAACWNAFDGVTTEAIEELGPLAGVMADPSQDRINELEAQRAELLEALQDIAAYYPNSWAADRARAAIAKATT